MMEQRLIRRVGSRLAQARKALGLSQQEVAEKIGITREYLSMIEGGRRLPNLELLSRLAAAYGRDVRAFLQEEEPGGAFRLLLRAAEVSEKEREAVSRFCDLCTDFAWLEQQLSMQTPPAPRYDMPPTSLMKPKELSERAKRLADAERRRLQLGEQPIRNIFHLMEQQGLHVVRLPIPDSEMDGAMAYDAQRGGFALVNAARSKGKQMFTAAHEYCHFLKDREEGYEVCRVDIGGKAKGVERFANIFAANFLMPETGLRTMLETQFAGKVTAESVVYLKRYYGVSYQSLLVRLQELGYVNQQQADKLKGIGLTGLEKRLYGDVDDVDEPEAAPPVPPLLAVLALEAYGRGLISLGRLAEIWQMSPMEVQELISEVGRGTAQ